MPRKADFGLVTIPGTVGELISIGQWANGDGYTDVDHAFILIDDQDTILEAEPGGARLRSYTEYDGSTITWSSWDLTDEERDRIAAGYPKYVDVPYSAADYFALASHRLHVPVPGLKTYVANSGHLICSQLVDRLYHDGGQEMFQDGRWDGYVTPASLRTALKGPVKA